MASLSFIEKETIRRLFDMGGGYVFHRWYTCGAYNKNKTKDILLDACAIDIYTDSEYRDLSQQKCIEKIWNEKDDYTVANLLEALAAFFSFQMGGEQWSFEDGQDYEEIEKIIKRLRSNASVTLPPTEDTQHIRLLAKDIETNISQNKPELALDRLHTYATKYIRELCAKHSVNVTDAAGKNYSLDGLVGQLRKYYENEKYCETEFSLIALKSSTSLFSKFNGIRNDHSFSHPNPILEKQEAEYVVKIMLATLMFIHSIEEHAAHYVVIDDDIDLPF